MRPFQSRFHVSVEGGGALDAWRGAARWAQSAALHSHSVSRADYEEKGGEYLKEHGASNQYVATPQPAG